MEIKEYAKSLIPQPFLIMGEQLIGLKDAKAWDRNDPTVKTAAKVWGYALVRMALAGAFFSALEKYKPHWGIASGVMATVVSAPATLMFWGARCVVYGLKTVKEQIGAPSFSLEFAKSFLAKDVAVGIGAYAIGTFIFLNSHNRPNIYGFRGGAEWLMTRQVPPPVINGKPY